MSRQTSETLSGSLPCVSETLRYPPANVEDPHDFFAPLAFDRDERGLGLLEFPVAVFLTSAVVRLAVDWRPKFQTRTPIS